MRLPGLSSEVFCPLFQFSWAIHFQGERTNLIGTSCQVTSTQCIVCLVKHLASILMLHISFQKGIVKQGVQSIGVHGLYSMRLPGLSSSFELLRAACRVTQFSRGVFPLSRTFRLDGQGVSILPCCRWCPARPRSAITEGLLPFYEAQSL